MSKSTVTQLFVSSVIAVAAGIVLAFAAVWAAFAGGVFVWSGLDVVGVQLGAFAWAMLGLAIVAGLAMVGGFIGGLVAWIGALLNTAQLEDKTWFVLLLVLGVLSFGLVAMVAYVIAGPDGTQPMGSPTAAAAPPTPVSQPTP